MVFLKRVSLEYRVLLLLSRLLGLFALSLVPLGTLSLSLFVGVLVSGL